MSTKKVYLRTLLLQRFRWMEDRVAEQAGRNGYAKITPAMSRMFGHMGGRPIGLSELARRLSISRQAVHKLANDAAGLGLVEFVPCPDNARIVRLQFSQAGWAMSTQAAREQEAMEEALKAQLGAKNLAELKRILALPWEESEHPPQQITETAATHKVNQD